MKFSKKLAQPRRIRLQWLPCFVHQNTRTCTVIRTTVAEQILSRCNLLTRKHCKNKLNYLAKTLLVNKLSTKTTPIVYYSQSKSKSIQRKLNYYTGNQNYCTSDPGNSTTVLPSSVGRQMGAFVNLTCASGYMAGSDGAPMYLCIANTSSFESWKPLSGSCNGAQWGFLKVYFWNMVNWL